MSTSAEKSLLTVALVGNPNTGKSTLFGALVGIHQHVGNYPGVTVEKKTGRMDYAGNRYELIDLPGLYSLAPGSRDEMVAVDVLLGRCPDCPTIDAVVCLLDASNLERNLYLASQVLEFGRPTVLAINMIDVAEKRGIAIDAQRLRAQVGVPVVAIQANRRVGLVELKRVLAEVAGRGTHAAATPLPEGFEEEVTRLEALLQDGRGRQPGAETLPRCLVRRLLLDASGYLQEALLPAGDAELRSGLRTARERLAVAGHGVPGVETEARYNWARRVLDGAVTQPATDVTTVTDRLDRILTHRLWGTLIFAALMVGVFQAVFRWATPLMDGIEGAFGAIGTWIAGGNGQAGWMAEGPLRSLLVEGILGGVGGVLVFLPQILILFLFIAVLEDCGYMARAAFLMDKLMSRVGLSGKSFIPMLSSFACAIPGIMAARVIENERDRLTTILVAPLMTCSARLPVYALLIAAFIPQTTYLGGLLGLQGLTLVALYVLGIGTAVVAALVLKRSILRGRTPPFVMELPSYKWPSLQTVLHRVGQRGWVFLRTAGTLILAVSVLVWAALYFPHDDAAVKDLVARQAALQGQLDTLDADDADGARRRPIAEELTQVDREIQGTYQRHSLLGKTGRLIEPVVRPLGWDWRIGCAVLASFPAREVVVATLGVIYNLGEDIDAESEEGARQFHARLHAATWDDSDPPRKVFTVPVALSIMVFFALCAQCAATLAVIRRETNSWRWPAFLFGYMTCLAYLGALLTYQIGTWIAGLA